tara:strand:+ start:12801 stop:13292 length:492 start_codon:yes stop_codon:yes gene_type:complete
MKSVILFRHGKSNWDIDYGLDHERPLSNKGSRDAKTMGKYLAKLNQIPELVISSTALRAKTTAELSIKEGGWKSKFILEKKIYQSLPEDLLNILKLLKDDKNIVCLTGHEPTFSSFISLSTNSSWIPFTTASMARLDYKIDRWENIKFSIGKLAWLRRPEELD